jgi:hypothetical protein
MKLTVYTTGTAMMAIHGFNHYDKERKLEIMKQNATIRLRTAQDKVGFYVGKSFYIGDLQMDKKRFKTSIYNATNVELSSAYAKRIW